MKRLFLSLWLLGCVSLNAAAQESNLKTKVMIEVFEDSEFAGIALIDGESNTLQLPGGDVLYGETVEKAIKRNILEKLKCPIYSLKQYHVYPGTMNDPSLKSVDVVFTASIIKTAQNRELLDQLYIATPENFPWDQISSDDAMVLSDYVVVQPKGTFGRLRPFGGRSK